MKKISDNLYPDIHPANLSKVQKQKVDDAYESHLIELGREAKTGEYRVLGLPALYPFNPQQVARSMIFKSGKMHFMKGRNVFLAHKKPEQQTVKGEHIEEYTVKVRERDVDTARASSSDLSGYPFKELKVESLNDISFKLYQRRYSSLTQAQQHKVTAAQRAQTYDKSLNYFKSNPKVIQSILDGSMPMEHFDTQLFATTVKGLAHKKALEKFYVRVVRGEGFKDDPDDYVEILVPKDVSRKTHKDTEIITDIGSRWEQETF